MNTIKFFTPVDFNLHNDSPAHTLLEACDDLLSFGSIKAEVIGPFDQSHNFYPVQLKQKTSTMVATAFKVFCLMTVVIPVIALVCKIFLRSVYQFQVVLPKAANTTPTQPTRGDTNSTTLSEQLQSALKTIDTLLNGNVDKNLLEKLMLESAKTGSLPTLQTLLSRKEDMVDAVIRTKAIKEAAESGHTHIVEKLLEGDPVLSEKERFAAMKKALEEGHDDIFNMLIETKPRIKTLETKKLLLVAATHDRSGILKKCAQNEDFIQDCLEAAIIAGKDDLIDELMKVIEPAHPGFIKEDFDSEKAIDEAIKNGHIDCLLKIAKDNKIHISDQSIIKIFFELAKSDKNKLDLIPFFTTHLEKIDKITLGNVLVITAQKGDFELLSHLHKASFFDKEENKLHSATTDSIIIWASRHQRLDIIKIILPPKSKPNDSINHLSVTHQQVVQEAFIKNRIIGEYLRENW